MEHRELEEKYITEDGLVGVLVGLHAWSTEYAIDSVKGGECDWLTCKEGHKTRTFTRAFLAMDKTLVEMVLSSASKYAFYEYLGTDDICAKYANLEVVYLPEGTQFVIELRGIAGGSEYIHLVNDIAHTA